MIRKLGPYGLVLFLGWSSLLAQDVPFLMNNVEVHLAGDTTRPITEPHQKRLCSICLDIIKRYRDEDRTDFYEEHQRELSQVTRIVDSLNHLLPPEQRVKQLVLLRGIQNMYRTENRGGEIALSTGFFFLYGSTIPLRTAIFHEMGHSFYDALTEEQETHVEQLWRRLNELGLIGLFKEGNYPRNLLIMGHPEDTPGELFASAFAILHVHRREFFERVWDAARTASERSMLLEVAGCTTLCTSKIQ